MAEVISLSKFRKPAKPRQAEAPPGSGPAFFCTRCNADRFKLYTSTLVRCAICNALMRNILVSSATGPGFAEEP